MRVEAGLKRGTKAAGLIALGASLGLLLDPRNGKRRRRMLRDRPIALARRGERRAERVAHLGAAKTRALAARTRHLAERPKSYDDVTLVNKVESEVFRFQEIPKGKLNVDAVNGIVTFRGQIERPEIIAEIIEKTREVEGVRQIENLMHLPGTEAPHHQPNGNS
jgi:osmotically-inducible protein OsmY